MSTLTALNSLLRWITRGRLELVQEQARAHPDDWGPIRVMVSAPVRVFDCRAPGVSRRGPTSPPLLEDELQLRKLETVSCDECFADHLDPPLDSLLAGGDFTMEQSGNAGQPK